MSLNHLTSRTDPMKGVLNIGCRSIETETIYTNPAATTLKINDNTVDVVTINTSTDTITTSADYDVDIGGNVTIDGTVTFNGDLSVNNITSANPSINFLKGMTVNGNQSNFNSAPASTVVNLEMKPAANTGYTAISGVNSSDVLVGGFVCNNVVPAAYMVSGPTFEVQFYCGNTAGNFTPPDGTQVARFSTTRMLIPLTTPSTSTATGALQISGGLGVAGTVNCDAARCATGFVRNSTYITATGNVNIIPAYLGGNGLFANQTPDPTDFLLNMPTASDVTNYLVGKGITPTAGLRLNDIVVFNASGADNITIVNAAGVSVVGSSSIEPQKTVVLSPVYNSGTTILVFVTKGA